MESPESPRACATACAKRPSWNPCWISGRPACSAASRRSFSSRPASASRSARARGESSAPASSRRCFSWSRKRWKSSSLISSAPAVAAVSSLIASARPEKKRSKSVSKVGRSTPRFTVVARSAARTVPRSGSPTTSSARSISMLSASETRTPFWRSRFVNSTSFASMDGVRQWLVLVQHVLVALHAGGLQLGPLQLHVLLELLLRLADVTLVLEDGGECLGDQLLIERLQVEQRERARPVERLADARGLLQVELADAVHDRDHVRRQPFGDSRDLETDDLELLRPIREVDEEMQAAALERVRHLTRVVAGQDDEGDVPRLHGAELGHAHLEVGQHLEEEGLELGVRLVDLVDEQHAGLLRADGAQERPRQDEAVAEEDIVLAGDPIHRLGERAGPAQHLADLVLQDLRVEELLRVLPLVEGLGLVEPLVALEANQLLAERGRQHLGELGLPHPGRAFHQDRLLHLGGQVDDRRDGVAGDVLETREALDDVVYGYEHAPGSSRAPRRADFG